MTIMEDYFAFRNFAYLRLDGNVQDEAENVLGYIVVVCCHQLVIVSLIQQQ